MSEVILSGILNLRISKAVSIAIKFHFQNGFEQQPYRSDSQSPNSKGIGQTPKRSAGRLNVDQDAKRLCRLLEAAVTVEIKTLGGWRGT